MYWKLARKARKSKMLPKLSKPCSPSIGIKKVTPRKDQDVIERDEFISHHLNRRSLDLTTPEVKEYDSPSCLTHVLTIFLLCSLLGCCYVAWWDTTAQVVLVASLSLIALALVIENEEVAGDSMQYEVPDNQVDCSYTCTGDECNECAATKFALQ